MSTLTDKDAAFGCQFQLRVYFLFLCLGLLCFLHFLKCINIFTEDTSLKELQGQAFNV